MIEFMKKGIQRTSIELSEANYELVHLYASLANGKLTYVLNYIIKMMVNIPDEVRNNLIDFCRERLIEAQENSYTFDERVKARIDAYKRLLKFLEGATTKKDVVLSGDVAKAKSVITFDLSAVNNPGLCYQLSDFFNIRYSCSGAGRAFGFLRSKISFCE